MRDKQKHIDTGWQDALCLWVPSTFSAERPCNGELPIARAPQGPCSGAMGLPNRSLAMGHAVGGSCNRNGELPIPLAPQWVQWGAPFAIGSPMGAMGSSPMGTLQWDMQWEALAMGPIATASHCNSLPLQQPPIACVRCVYTYV